MGKASEVIGYGIRPAADAAPGARPPTIEPLPNQQKPRGLPDASGARPPAIEPLSNRWLVHRLARCLLPACARLGVSPNLVTLAGLAAGLGAAAAYAHWRDPAFALLGFLLMLVWHVLDGLDGMLARATGRASPAGRLLDGLADYLVFAAVYAALAFSFTPAWPAVLLAAAAGAAHAVQAAFYEAQRATYARRARGLLAAPPRPCAGGRMEALYNRVERHLGNRTAPFDRALGRAAPQARAAALARWTAEAERVHRWMELASANGRTVVILLACLLASPVLFWLWELAALSLLCAWSAARLRTAEAAACASLAAARA